MQYLKHQNPCNVICNKPIIKIVIIDSTSQKITCISLLESSLFLFYIKKKPTLLWYDCWFSFYPTWALYFERRRTMRVLRMYWWYWTWWTVISWLLIVCCLLSTYSVQVPHCILYIHDLIFSCRSRCHYAYFIDLESEEENECIA